MDPQDLVRKSDKLTRYPDPTIQCETFKEHDLPLSSYLEDPPDWGLQIVYRITLPFSPKQEPESRLSRIDRFRWGWA